VSRDPAATDFVTTVNSQFSQFTHIPVDLYSRNVTAEHLKLWLVYTIATLQQMLLFWATECSHCSSYCEIYQ